MQKVLYGVARRLLDQETRSRIDGGLASARKKCEPVLRLVYGTFDSADLAAELRRVLPGRFDVLMVHCAFDGLQPMYRDGPLQLLKVLEAVVGPERTLAMPAFTFLVPDGDLPGHLRRNGRFDVRRQPSQMGVLSEMFRRTPGVLRSLHPTHSVCARGPLASRLTGEHHLATSTFGARSPFARMAELDTVILGLGKPYYRVLTQTHVPEDLLGDRFPVPRTFEEVDVVLVDGTGEHPGRVRIDTTGAERKLHRLPRLVGPGLLTDWSFHGVPLFWTQAGRLTAAMCEEALRGRTVYDGPTLA